MEKTGNRLGIQPIANINPVKAIAGVGQFAQSLESRERLLAKHSASFLNSGLAKPFSAQKSSSVSSADLSPLAKYINQSLQQADAKGLSGQIISRQLVTSDPTQTATFSKALGQTISQSGLFYESHLADFIDGHRPLANLKLEPQVQSYQIAYAMLPQQLHLLEHQRIAWHGEVWPNQFMEWHIQLPKEAYQQASETSNIAAQVISTELALTLPKLGKVRAHLRLVNGKLSVQLHAASKNTLVQFEQHRNGLSHAMALHGQSLEMLSIQSEQVTESAAHA